MDVFSYQDYRVFLGDFYRSKKAQNKKYSYRRFAQLAGLKSDNYLKLVTEGKRGLTHRNIHKFCKGLGLREKENLYFENLVWFNQSKDPNEKTFFASNLELIRSQNERVALSKDQYDVISKWYPLVIRELTLVKDFTADTRWIARRLAHHVAPQEIKTAIDQLLRLGFLVKDGEKLRVNSPFMQTPDQIPLGAVEKYHAQMLDFAKESIQSQTSHQRCLSAITFAVRMSDLPRAFKRIHAFRNEMDSTFSQGDGHDSVYQLNIQLFRLDQDDA